MEDPAFRPLQCDRQHLCWKDRIHSRTGIQRNITRLHINREHNKNQRPLGPITKNAIQNFIALHLTFPFDECRRRHYIHPSIVAVQVHSKTRPARKSSIDNPRTKIKEQERKRTCRYKSVSYFENVYVFGSNTKWAHKEGFHREANGFHRDLFRLPVGSRTSE